MPAGRLTRPPERENTDSHARQKKPRRPPRGFRIDSLPRKRESSLTSSLVVFAANPLRWVSPRVRAENCALPRLLLPFQIEPASLGFDLGCLAHWLVGALRKHASGMFLASDRSGYAARREPTAKRLFVTARKSAGGASPSPTGEPEGLRGTGAARAGVDPYDSPYRYRKRNRRLSVSPER